MLVERFQTREEYLKSDEYWGGHGFDDVCEEVDDQPLLGEFPQLESKLEKKFAKKLVKRFMEGSLDWSRLDSSEDFNADDYDVGTILRFKLEKRTIYNNSNLQGTKPVIEYLNSNHEGVVLEVDGVKHVLVVVRYDEGDCGVYQGCYFPSSFKSGEVRHARPNHKDMIGQMSRVSSIEILEDWDEDGEDDQAPLIVVVARALFGQLVPQPVRA